MTKNTSELLEILVAGNICLQISKIVISLLSDYLVTGKNSRKKERLMNDKYSGVVEISWVNLQ